MDFYFNGPNKLFKPIGEQWSKEKSYMDKLLPEYN